MLLARPFVLHKLGTIPPVEKGPELLALLETFFGFSLPQTFTAESLATELAKRTRFLRDVVADELRDERERGDGMLLGFHEAFERYLIAELDPVDFADLYAQTITYGLFAARTRAGADFSRRTAFEHIPRTIGVLREVFQFISLGDLPKQLAWVVDDLAEVLAVAEAGEILDRYYREGRGSDPIIHFYETFLAVYDPAERERRGVYYTPEPVVSYIVRSLHRLLKTEFGRPDGLASEGVTLLDPAAGTMTFVARAVEEAVREFEAKYGAGGRGEFIRRHILPHFYAFELMMAPYAVGHLKMGFYLEELGHRLEPDERFQLYLTNTLEMEELEQTRLPGMASLAHESRLAGEVKKQTPILVVLGNPPYSGHSANMGDWIRGLIEDYKKDAPELHKPAQAKWLQNDYVKFLRFAQYKIDEAGHGVIGMITSHSYLDNPTFRGMRQSLLRSFDEIWLLDLHGGSLKRETAPDGSNDENVFDIRQGVAICFLVKRPSADRRELPARVRYSEVWGSRERKYAWLDQHDVTSTDWETIDPQKRLFLFRPVDRNLKDIYDEFPAVPDIFNQGGPPAPGMVTTQDEFAISWSAEEMQRKVRLLLGTQSEEEARALFRLCSQSQWNYERAKQELADGKWRDDVVPVLYRPLDTRWTVYNKNVAVHRRDRVMRHMRAGPNRAIIVPRQNKDDFGAFVSEFVGTHKTASAYDINYYFPLNLHPDKKRNDLFSEQRKPNLDPKLLATLAEMHGREPTPERVFHYVYAVLYAPTYRARYNEFLKTDFPRIPFTADAALFDDMAALGERLTALHLLRSPALDPPLARFHGEGDGRVAKNRGAGFRYDADAERVWINEAQHFAPVPPELWEYTIGGYQVLEKWLKDRRERQLSLEEIKTYCRIVTALAGTVELQAEIDARYEGVEENLISAAT